MAEVTTTATRPTRGSRRISAKTAPAKVAITAAPGGEDTTKVVDGNVERLVVTLEYVGDTKSYAKFVFPEDSVCAGTVYAPRGTQEVRVALRGGAE